MNDFTVPASVVADRDLSPFARILLGVIRTLGSRGAFAWSDVASAFGGTELSAIDKGRKRLVAAGYLREVKLDGGAFVLEVIDR